MSIHAPVTNLSPHVREAFDAGCRAVFKVSEQRAWAGRASHDLLWRFAAHYQRLIALPRRTRRSIERRWKRTLSAIALLMTLGQAPASAAIMQIAPNTPPAINADGKCSLIEAIVNANRDARPHLDCVPGAGNDVIMLPEMSTQQLRAAELLPQITSRIVIEGHQSTIRRIAWSGADVGSFFHVTASGDLTLNETTISGELLSGGSRPGVVGVRNDGGLITLNNSSIVQTICGLDNRGGTAVLENSVVYLNGRGSAPYYYDAEGGITNRGGTLTLRNSVVKVNRSNSGSGGIDNDSGSTATVIDSIVSYNWNLDYEGMGGGIRNDGKLTLIGSTVSANVARFGVGGGIANRGTATVIRSTIFRNESYFVYEGGGIQNRGTLRLINSTVSFNEAYSGKGGGVNSGGGELTLVSSTVTGNTAEGGGAGLFVHEGGTVTLKRSIVSGNSAPTTRGLEITISSTAGAVTADDYNLFGYGGDAGIEGFTPGTTDIVPNETVGGILLQLANNGGGTVTHALAIGSPALDASPDDATCPATDQRGNPRPRGPACDIGSFEGSAVLCKGQVTTIVGTDGPDELTGTSSTDVISGLNGNDAIGGLGGNDVICGGGGADSLFGSLGNDVLFGQGGNDSLFGHRGNDTLNGGPGQDECDGGIHTGAGDTADACETISNVP